MRIERVLAAAGAAFVMLLGSVAAQQAPAAPAQPPAAPAAGRGQGPGGRGRVATFPAQQRPPGDPALDRARENALFLHLQRLPRR